MYSTVLPKTRERKQVRVYISIPRGRPGKTVHFHTWDTTWGFSSISHGIDRLPGNGRGDEIWCTECRTPAEAHPLLCAPYERFGWSPEIV
jgi:hypothetical protein